jgi:hypothetical protein
MNNGREFEHVDAIEDGDDEVMHEWRLIVEALQRFGASRFPLFATNR